ncbi:MAG: hypothetical protein MK136_10645, partial [Pirellulaceae bacterium]|nr:hypothetical protein [Pirellulaceae bacterium]
ENRKFSKKHGSQADKGHKSLLPTPGDAADFSTRCPGGLLNRGLRLGTLESGKPMACVLKRSMLGLFARGAGNV